MSFLPVSCSRATTIQLPQLLHSKSNVVNKSQSRLLFMERKRIDKSIDQTVSWTSSIANYCRNGMLSEAVEEFSRMRLAGVEPNDITLVTLLSCCAHFPCKAYFLGVLLHGYILKFGFDKNNVMLWTALVDMYSKCRCMGFARKLFDEMCMKNTRSWNTMIDGYMKNGDVESAVLLFDEMPVRDKISWTALINGFVKRGLFNEALECFQDMQQSGVEPDHVTIISVLSACANLGVLGLGIWMHYYAMKCGFDKNIRVRNSLIDMYSRCGCIEFARQVFQNMDTRSVVSWNSMIVGLAINGYAEDALEHFYLMQRHGFKPDGVSFTGALTACSHAGLVEKGHELYTTMTKVYQINPRIEHYGCLVDLLSRAGWLEDAFSVIESMPMKHNEVILGSLLASCRTHGNISLAERLTRYLFDSELSSDSNYVTLSNMYAAVGRWDGVGKVRRTMKAHGISKRPAVSAIEVHCSIHEFMAGDKSHIDSKNIYAILDQLSVELGEYGYVPETNVEDLTEYG
ncbi:Pentatricopeptide repeat-containing protein [Thalictrum thalictroides]|uniref:Pentatricopeptide repeat-containing protein n=1 Tax=Thalictrum thalictroides TaxID=46969 RepID=A0A7J6W558_THATH|nr:Pentatricopeptide repeat-containing protein [Thalictrum thalictroides]